MAIVVNAVWFGVQAIVDEDTTRTVIDTLNAGGSISGAISAGLAAGTVVPAAVVTAIVSAALFLGAGGIAVCDSARKGIIITVLWIGVPWCTGR